MSSTHRLFAIVSLVTNGKPSDSPAAAVHRTLNGGSDRRESLSKVLLFFGLVVLGAGLPFALLHCDPLVDDHGYLGDETMNLTMALNGAMDGTQSYGSQPDGTPVAFASWIPLLKVVYGPALIHVDPVWRVEMGRLVSRLLCLLGVLVWVLSSLYFLSDERRSPRCWSRAYLLALLASLMFLSFPPMVFIASNGRNDSLGFLLACLTYLASAYFLRHPTQPLAAALLFLAVGAGYWGHFAAPLLSAYLACLAVALAAAKARHDARLRLVCRNAAAGFLLGGIVFGLLVLVSHGPAAVVHPTSGAHTRLLSVYLQRLASSVVDAPHTFAQGIRRWLVCPEIPVAFSAIAVSGLALALLRRRSSRLEAHEGRLPGPILVAFCGLPLLATLVGLFITAYYFQDVYRPMALAAYLSAVLLSVQIQPWSDFEKERATFAVVISVALGLSLLAHLYPPAFERFADVWTDWRGYRPFDHSVAPRPLPEAASHEMMNRVANQTRSTHLRQLDAYLAEKRIGGLITVDPMLLLLRRKGLAIYYFRYQVAPVTRLPEVDEDAAILRNVVFGNGVRLLAATRNGLVGIPSAIPQPLRTLRECIRHSWRRASGFTCSAGGSQLSLTLEWSTATEGPPYAYGVASSTPIRLYRLTPTQMGWLERP